jgi:S1-C subfamily serine protease
MLIIESFEENSDGRSAGLRQGDVIIKVNGISVSTVQDIVSSYEHGKEGDIIPIETERGIFNVRLVKDIPTGGAFIGIRMKK